ncbi:Zn-dependent hydrolase [Alcaligenaceae bacterium LF4-65]|uniref:Zn-dependent hydrolase n=1 Tax=Zwartia hollandica TaxID=324606 RepID=A0A953T3B8_9BURK|nr:Zn-dependent hydrolase [Zwartia hollandica]MBZ1351275.1 Zn-dependent hydrolase [Zwartia hollandica]
MNAAQLAINGPRLMRQLEQLAEIGRTETNACCRLALTDDDKLGRDLVVSWMKELGMTVTIDPIGNIFGTRAGSQPDLAPVMTGSHIDTVRTGGAYDGNYGVLAGLEVVATLNEAKQLTQRSLVVGVFTNEEGARFAPDMLGSLVYVGGMPLDEALDLKAIDGPRLGDELARIGYDGKADLGAHKPHAFIELHIEQGPILDIEGVKIGAVENLQGISWQELTIVGQSNHAGTTPMYLRHDAGYVASAIATFVRDLTRKMGGHQVGTIGKIDLIPNLINVIAARATITVDLRNTDEGLLKQAEHALATYLKELEQSEGVTITARRLARFEPVSFDTALADRIAHHAQALGLSQQRMTSGAGHDAQMLARICPTSMIFVPSVGGISHNPAEYTAQEDLIAGANVLLASLTELAN